MVDEDAVQFQISQPRISVSSVGSRYWSQVLEGAEKDIETEIAFARDKISFLLRHRQIELDPNFWALDDDSVNLLKNGNQQAIEQQIEREETRILEFKTKLSRANKMTRYMRSNQAIFHCAIDKFAKLLPVPEETEPTDKIFTLAESMCSQLRLLEETKMKNVELEMKLASLDEQVHGLQGRLKEFGDSPRQVANAHSWLEAVGLQNCMLNELLSKITQDVKVTSQGMKILENGEPHEVRRTVRESLNLSFGVVDECFPNLNASRHSATKYLWVPHDVSIGTWSLQQLMQHFTTSERLNLNMIQGLKHLKKSVKQLEETHEKITDVKKKIVFADHRKISNHAQILRYSIPKCLENEGNDKINAEIEKDSLSPVHSGENEEKKNE